MDLAEAHVLDKFNWLRNHLKPREFTMRIFLLLLTFGIANAFCLDEWFTIPVGSGGFNQVDYSGTVLTLFPSNGSNMSIPGSTSGSANTNQLNITAPNGKENVYLAMV